MKKLIAFFVAVVAAGYALHQTARITETFPYGWEQGANYAVGVSGALPFFCVLLKMAGFTDRQILSAATAYLAVFVAFGIGVMWGRSNDKQSDTEVR